MDDRRFDALARALAGASTRRGVLATLAGTGLGLRGGDATDVGARRRTHPRRRRRCRPACGAGQTCVKGTCACDGGGTPCGDACCVAGQSCVDGACVTPEPQCVPLHGRCKDTGLICCDGLTCASGQGGQDDVGCYRPAGAPCAASGECAFGARCIDGRCTVETTCDARTCGDGCCAGNECLPGSSIAACGAAGAACVDCAAAGDACVAGACACGNAPACTGTTDTCLAGDCTCGGQAPCTPGQTCFTENGTTLCVRLVQVGGPSPAYPNAYATVQAAIDAASAGEAVRVLAGTYDGGVRLAGKNLAIVGSTDERGEPVTVLTRSAGGPVVGIASTGASLSFLRITGGVQTGQGGGVRIYNTGSSTPSQLVTLYGCVVSDNEARHDPSNNDTGDGGGIWAHTTPLTLIRCTVENNVAGRTGGGIATSDVALLLDRTTVRGNTAPGAGGIHAFAGSIELRGGATVTGNASSGNGAGGLWAGNLSAPQGIPNCAIAGNLSTGAYPNCEAAGSTTLTCPCT